MNGRIKDWEEMYGQLHVNHVLYKLIPALGALPIFRQIAVVEGNQFELRIFGGEVIQKDPKFIAETADAEVYFHPTLENALADAEKEFQQSINSCEWHPYHPITHTP